jgi:uncharacterized protein (TIGR02246 family)
MDADAKAILAVLDQYRAALTAGDLATIADLFATDGVLMAPEAPASVGTQAIRHAYEAIFKAVKLDIQFKVAEIVQVSPEWAFARTTSAGSVKINATGLTIPEANQELFIFRKDGKGAWKIARYSFSVTTSAPK